MSKKKSQASVGELSDLYIELRAQIFVLQQLTSLMAAMIEDLRPDAIRDYLNIIRSQVRDAPLEPEMMGAVLRAFDSFPVPDLKLTPKDS